MSAETMTQRWVRTSEGRAVPLTTVKGDILAEMLDGVGQLGYAWQSFLAAQQTLTSPTDRQNAIDGLAGAIEGLLEFLER